MKWHESKFWRAVAVISLFLLGGILLQLGGAGQTVGAADAPGASARLSDLRDVGLVPWDLARGTFVSASDQADRIVVWDLGPDWQSSITFKVVKSKVYRAGS